MTAPSKISIIKQILDLFTWKKIFQLFCFLIIIGLSIGLYENRTVIYSWLPRAEVAVSPQNFKLSKESINEIDAIVHKSDLVIGLQITLVDFSRNTRIIAYSSIDDEYLKDAYKKFQDKNLEELPLFNTDPANNVRMSQLINGDYVCNPFKETLTYKLAPEAAKSVEYICASGIPPYYGKFTGIVSLYLKKQPTTAETEQLRTVSRDMAISVFNRDFK